MVGILDKLYTDYTGKVYGMVPPLSPMCISVNDSQVRSSIHSLLPNAPAFLLPCVVRVPLLSSCLPCVCAGGSSIPFLPTTLAASAGPLPSTVPSLCSFYVHWRLGVRPMYPCCSLSVFRWPATFFSPARIPFSGFSVSVARWRAPAPAVACCGTRGRAGSGELAGSGGGD